MLTFNLLVFILILMTISNVVWLFAYYVSRRSHKAAQDVIKQQQINMEIMQKRNQELSARVNAYSPIGNGDKSPNHLRTRIN